jgi:hypothetical protein
MPAGVVICFMVMLQEWAGVLASPHVLRLADACSTAEDAALGAAMAGMGAEYVSKAVGVCLQGIHEWEHGETQVSRSLVCCHLAGSFEGNTHGRHAVQHLQLTGLTSQAIVPA